MEHTSQQENFQKESIGGIPISHNEENLPLLTHPGHSIEEGEGEVHLLLFRLQSLRTDHHKGIAMAIQNIEKIG